MASRMTRAVAKDERSMYANLKDVAALFERAQQQVFKLMAGVCIVLSKISFLKVSDSSRIRFPNSRGRNDTLK